MKIKENQIRYELVSVKPFLNRSVLPITSTLVVPELTVEPRDVREYGHMCPGTPPLATSYTTPFYRRFE